MYFAVHVGGTLDPAREEMEREYQDLHGQVTEETPKQNPSNRIPQTGVIQNPEDLSAFSLDNPVIKAVVCFYSIYAS